MAIYKGTAGKRIGSVGNETYSMVKGQNVVREKPAQVANPRTYAQMEQRSIFVDAVRFYEHANKNLFKFAFEDKRSYESDYNAFMRANSKNGVNISPTMSGDYRFPAIGNWLLTSGSLQGLPYFFDGEDLRLQLVTEVTGDPITTVGGLSTKLKADYPLLMDNDIITIVTIESSAFEFSEEDLRVLYDSDTPSRWNIRQFRINEASTVTLESLGISNVTVGDDYVNLGTIDTNVVSAAAVIVSREVPGGVKVSTSSIINNTKAETFITAFVRNKARIIAEWGLSDPAILQGSIADGQ